MPRAPRIYIDNTCYHLIARGNQKQEIFRDDSDYLKYLSLIRKAKRKYGVSLYTYCLMSNHIHLLAKHEVSRVISKFMHWLNLGYVRYFNAKYGKVGHLWQGRFRGKPILKEEYLINCATYIEGNPVRAKLVNDVADYKWSSYRERCLLSGKDLLDEISE